MSEFCRLDCLPPARRRRRVSLAWSAAAVVLSLGVPVNGSASWQTGTTAQAQQRARDAEALAEFKAKVGEYAALRRELDKKVPALPAQAPPEAVRAHEIALQNAIVAARPRAKEGDIFVNQVRPILRGICRQMLTGPEGRKRLAAIREEPVQKALRAKINERYPDQVPLSAVPYPLLKALPALPDELEYRFLADDLVLLDLQARLIVDVLRDALPR